MGVPKAGGFCITGEYITIIDPWWYVPDGVYFRFMINDSEWFRIDRYNNSELITNEFYLVKLNEVLADVLVGFL